MTPPLAPRFPNATTFQVVPRLRGGADQSTGEKRKGPELAQSATFVCTDMDTDTE